MKPAKRTKGIPPAATPRARFETVRKARVYEDVVRQIQRLVGDGLLRPGDKLPPERELASKFGVGRSSIRDAIRTLQLMGLVEPRQGDGTVVRDLSAESLVVPIATMLIRRRELAGELMDVRRMIEPPLAARAAANATPDEIAHLEDVLRRQKEKVRRGATAIEEDSEFHYTIARAARNRVVMKVLDVLMDLLRESRERSLQVKGRSQWSLTSHRQVLEAIRRRAPGEAEAAMRRHIRGTQRIILKGI